MGARRRVNQEGSLDPHQFWLGYMLYYQTCAVLICNFTLLKAVFNTNISHIPVLWYLLMKFDFQTEFSFLIRLIYIGIT